MESKEFHFGSLQPDSIRAKYSSVKQNRGRESALCMLEVVINFFSVTMPIVIFFNQGAPCYGALLHPYPICRYFTIPWPIINTDTYINVL